MRFKSGLTYLVKVGKYWYIVQQAGQRSWEALLFSHTQYDAPEVTKYYHGNSGLLEELINEADGLDDFDYVGYKRSSELRKAMFTILKYGEIRKEL